jgi:flavodoxin
MPKALVLYHTGTAGTRSIAEKVKKRLEDLDMEVVLSGDEEFRDSKSTSEYDVIALGAPCLACRDCHGAAECRGAKKLRKKLKKLFAMDLAGKKLITFANSADPTKHDAVCRRIESLMAPTKIKPIASIGCGNELPDNFDAILKTAVQEHMFK